MHDVAVLIYDGECPVCTNYARMVRLQDTLGELQIINAREGGPEVEEVRALGLSIDEGMVLKMGGLHYHGADCLHRLALMSSRSDVFNKLTHAVFKSQRLSRLLYPTLRAGRNLLLRILGKERLGF